MRTSTILTLCASVLTATCNVQPGDAPAPPPERSIAPKSGKAREPAPAPTRPTLRPPRGPRRDRRTSRPGPQPPSLPAGPGVAAEPWPAPGGVPERVVIQDLDGDGKPEVVLASRRGLIISDARGKALAKAEALGHPNVLALGAPGGPDRGTLYVGWGYGRHHRSGAATLVRYTYARGALTPQPIHTHESPKPLFAGIAPGTWRGRPGVLVAAFRDKYNVGFTFLTPKGAAWRAEPVETIRMATSFALVPARRRGVAELVVGRVYGDQRGAPGDAFLWEGPGRRKPIAIQGGVRAVTGADLDGDGIAEILIGDGWAAAYAKDGRAIVTRAFWKGGVFATERLGTLPGEFMVQKLEAADMDGDGKPEILALGNASVTMLRRSGPVAWALSRLVSGAPQDFTLGDLDGDGKPDLLVVDRQSARLVRNAALR